MNWITKQLAEVFNDYTSAALDFFSNFIISIFDRDVEIFTSTEISAACTVTKLISISLVILFSLKHIWDIYVTEQDGDSDSDPLQIIVNASVSLALIESNDFIFITLRNLSKKFTSDLVGSVSASDFTVKMSSLLELLLEPDKAFLFISIMIIVLLIFVIIFSFKAGRRAVELSLMKVLFPIMAVDKMGTGQERWNSFVETYVQTYFGYALQLFLIRLGINRAVAAMVEGTNAKFGNYFAGLCLFWVAISLPKWLDRFTYSSGIGGFLKTSTSTAVRSAVRMIRR